MRNTVEGIYKLLPFHSDIKFLIYTQLYKHIRLSDNFKEDLKTYLTLNYIIEKYRTYFQTDYLDYYFLYSLYNDLLFENHTQKLEDNQDDVLFYNFCYDSMVIETESLRNNHDYTFLVKKIKYYWKLLSPNRRKKFIIYANIKYY